MRVIIDDRSIKSLIRKTNLPGTTLTSEALGLLSWAIEEVSKGKKIISVDSDAEIAKGTQVFLQSLEAVKDNK